MTLSSALSEVAERTNVRLDAESAPDRKARGAFYTPPEVAAFIANWAIRSPNDHVLEPSAGDGAFLAAAVARFAALGRKALRDQLVGIELTPAEVAKAMLAAPGARVRQGSFFDVGAEELPARSAVIGNPPYIRYHGFTGSARASGLARAREQGVDLSGLASSWAHFVVHAASFLPDHGGRLGLVLPAELLHTEYAAPVRAFLLRRFASVLILAFDQALFDTAQVDAVILLASDDGPAGLHLIRRQDISRIADDVGPDEPAVDRAGDRWSGELDAEAAALHVALAASDRFMELGAVASVDIGVVTGANGFFIFDEARRAELGLPLEATTPIVDRPSALVGVEVRSAANKHLLRLPRVADAPLGPAIERYLEAGRLTGVAQGYKCRVRPVWYAVPTPKHVPELFLPYMSHLRPRLVVNSIGSLSTNLIHGVHLRPGSPDARILAAAALSSATMLSAEIVGRSYGGGVLKLETREAERLLVPLVSSAEGRALRRRFNRLDRLVAAGAIETASAVVDDLLGIDHAACSAAAAVYRDRRLGRAGSRRRTAISPV
jgi:adenine-specific DNA methylase